MSRNINRSWPGSLRGGIVRGALCMFMVAMCMPAFSKYPEEAIKVLAGFPPGGSTDVTARILAESMSKVLDSPVVVINRPGAGGNIATRELARAKPDGYTLMLGGSYSQGINPVLYKDTSYDPVKDFTHIALIANIPSIIATNNSIKINTLDELIEQAKKAPGKITYATGGNGTPAHISSEAFQKAFGIKLTHIPFKGGSAGVLAVMNGEVDMIVGTPPVVLPHIANNMLNPLAVTWPERYSIMPDIPGMKEFGHPDLALDGWFGIFGPAGIPQDIQDVLFKAIDQVLSDPVVIEKLAAQGLDVQKAASPAEFAKYVEEQSPIWGQLVIESGAIVE